MGNDRLLGTEKQAPLDRAEVASPGPLVRISRTVANAVNFV
ncbi:MAG: hypothetical protein R3C12_23615 [Planctomycetaceae bacterium]